jgi:hypothetical protein
MKPRAELLIVGVLPAAIVALGNVMSLFSVLSYLLPVARAE